MTFLAKPYKLENFPKNKKLNSLWKRKASTGIVLKLSPGPKFRNFRIQEVLLVVKQSVVIIVLEQEIE